MTTRPSCQRGECATGGGGHPQAIVSSRPAPPRSLNATGVDGRPLAVFAWRAVSFSLPELDPACGPGRYTFKILALPLVLLSGETAPRSITLAAALFPADAGSGLPGLTYISTAFFDVGPITATPAYFSLPLPAEWAVDTTALRALAVVVRTTAGGAVGVRDGAREGVGWGDSLAVT